MTTLLNLKPSDKLDAQQLFSVYRGSLNRFAELVRENGYEVSTFDPAIPSRFNDLPLDVRIMIIERINAAILHCENARKDRIPTHDHRQFAWWIIRDMKLRPKSDAFNDVESDDIIEIYNASHLQIHRSFNFFGYLSYTLDQIFTHEWWELYSRVPAVTEAMLKMSDQYIGLRESHTILKPFPDHWVSEIFSSAQNASFIEPRQVSTLLDSNGYALAYMNVFRIGKTAKKDSISEE